VKLEIEKENVNGGYRGLW
jgi:hypothetical protein